MIQTRSISNRSEFVVALKDTKCGNIDAMKIVLNNVWEGFPMLSIKNSILSWRKRLTDVFNEDGGHIE